MKNRIAFPAVAALTIALVTTSCASLSSSDSARTGGNSATSSSGAEASGISDANGQSKSPECASGNIHIAFAGPLSGPNASIGKQELQGLQLAVKELNSAGGITAGDLKGCEVAIDGPYDDKSDPSTGATIATHVASDANILAYFGDMDSGVTLAALPILARANVPMINSYSSNPKITSSGYKNVIRLIPTDDVKGQHLAEQFINRFKDKTIAVAYPNDSFGQGLNKAFTNSLKKLGGTVANDYAYADDQTDFSVFVTSVNNDRPDGIALLGTYTTSAAIVKQLGESGVKASSELTIIGQAGNDTAAFVDLAGSAANGVYVDALWSTAAGGQTSEEFYKKFESAMGNPPDPEAAITYDGFNVFAAAVADGGTTRSALSEKLHEIRDYHGVTGTVTIAKNGQNSAATPVLKVVKDGKLIAAEN